MNANYESDTFGSLKFISAQSNKGESGGAELYISANPAQNWPTISRLINPEVSIIYNQLMIIELKNGNQLLTR